MSTRNAVIAGFALLGATSALLTSRPGQEATDAGTAWAAGKGAKTKIMIEKVVKSDEEWKKILTPIQYQVLRQAGTERAFTGEYWQNHEKGTYVCAACGLELFESDTKFDSGCGWPSFYESVRPEAVELIEDTSLGMTRTEVRCANCGSHLGHVFPDGFGTPTGDRYCMNSIALDFTPES